MEYQSNPNPGSRRPPEAPGSYHYSENTGYPPPAPASGTNVPPNFGTQQPFFGERYHRLQQACASSQCLLIAILTTLTALISIVSSILSSDSGGTAAGLGIGALPLILICIGIWMIYAGSGKGVNPSGFQLIKIGVTIEMVIVILVAVLCTLAIVFAGVVVADFGGMDENVGVYAFLGIAVIAILVVTILYYNSLRKMVGSLQFCASGTDRPLLASTFVQVMLLLSGIFSVIEVVALLFMSGMAEQLSFYLSSMSGTEIDLSGLRYAWASVSISAVRSFVLFASISKIREVNHLAAFGVQQEFDR